MLFLLRGSVGGEQGFSGRSKLHHPLMACHSSELCCNSTAEAIDDGWWW
jgi:hypothetical protein